MRETDNGLKNQLEPQKNTKVSPPITRSHAHTNHSNPAYTTLAHDISTDQMGIHCWLSMHEPVLHGKDSAASSDLRSTTMWTRPHAGARPMHQSLRASSLHGLHRLHRRRLHNGLLHRLRHDERRERLRGIRTTNLRIGLSHMRKIFQCKFPSLSQDPTSELRPCIYHPRTELHIDRSDGHTLLVQHTRVRPPRQRFSCI